MTRYPSDFPATQLISADDLPLSKFLPTEDIDALIDRLAFRVAEEAYDPATQTTTVSYGFVVDPEATFGLPGLGGIELVMGGDSTLLGVEFVGSPDAASLTLSGGVALRFPREWLRPVTKEEGAWVDDPTRDHVELGFGGGVTVDDDFDVSFEGSNEFTIQPAMVGETGLVVEGTVAVDLSETTGLDESASLGLDPSWRGVVFTDVEVHLPDDLDVPAAPSGLSFEDFHIGGGGITGTVSGEWDPGDAEGDLFGMEFELREVSIEFVETALVGASFDGSVTLPFFEESADLRVGIAADGTITAELDDDDGLVDIDHDAFSLTVEGLSFSTEGTPAVSLSGTLTPKLIPDAPGVSIDELRIDADGTVHVEGGWLALPDQYSIDFYGFGFEITAFGLGTNDDGSKWVGLNGSLALADELGAGASVEGLRVTWFDEGPNAGDPPSVSFDGIGVELEIPEAVRFKGDVSYRERVLQTGGTDHRFEGAISLDLLALDISVDGTLVVGTREEGSKTFPYLAVYLGVDLPTGIPLFSTGLSLYGFSGLYSQNMAPALTAGEEWFSRESGVESWYHRDPEGVTGFGGDPPKWPVEEGSLAFGAGVTLGTASDNGFAFSGSLLLLISFPGPVVMLNGEANLLAERAELDAGEPNFSALAVLDSRAGTFTFGLDANYRYGEEGELVDIGASVEAFYQLNDPTAWYVYIGRKEPREKRVRASLFSLFEANGYVMLDPRQLAVGAWYGYDKSYSFGPLGVDIEAWLSGDAVVSFQPAHFSAAIAARGAVRLRAFGFTAGISLDASLAAEVFDPFHLLGRVKVSLELPGFLPDPSATVTLEWGPRPEAPTIPEPLDSVAIGHEVGTVTWPLELDDTRPPEEEIPVVPLDGRPQLTFATPVHDDGFDATTASLDTTPTPVGENANRVDPAFVRIGDPAANEGPVKARYGLEGVRVERETATGWEPLPDVYGTWAPVPTLPEGDRTEGEDPPLANTKLSLFTPNPYEYVRHTGGTWGETLAERHPDYPCRAVRDCWSFAGRSASEFTVDANAVMGLPVTRVSRDGRPDWPTFQHVATQPPATPTIRDVGTDEGVRRALTLGVEPFGDGSALQYLAIDLPTPRKSVAVEARGDKGCAALGLFAVDSEGESVSVESATPNGDSRLVVTSREGDIERVGLVSVHVSAGRTTEQSGVSLFSVCASSADLGEADPLTDVRERTVENQVARLGDESSVFDPYETYRLVVDTTVVAKGIEEFDWFETREQTRHVAYFRTEGPPALASLSKPAGADAEYESDLADLTRYVRSTVPETIPDRGEKPSLPRPVFRAYDVGVDFSETHVDRLYRSAGRDLALLLFDRNNRPARTPDDRLHSTRNQWGHQVSLLSDVAERQWLQAIDRGDCTEIREAVVARDDRVTNAVGLGLLAPDQVYDARLVPRLLREGFGVEAYYGGTPPWTTVDSGPMNGSWVVEGHPERTGDVADPTANGIRLQRRDANGSETTVDADLSGVDVDDVVRFAAATGEKTFRITAVDEANATVEVDRAVGFERSRWLIPGRGVARQTAAAAGNANADSQWVREATTGTPDPATWTDYRIEVAVRLDDADSLAGLVVRRDPATGAGVRYVVDGRRSERRLVHDDGSDTTTLHRGRNRPVAAGQSVDVEVDVVGETVRVVEDGELVATSTLDGLEAGGIALSAQGPATFGEVRVDDLSTTAPVAYRFSFTTSWFANAAHLLGSYADETWTATASESDPEPRVSLADAGTPVSADEGRAYEAFRASLDRSSASVERVEATAVERNGAVRGLLVESPEPLDWSRTTLEVRHTDRPQSAAVAPRGMKVTDVSYGSNEEVGVLVTESMDLTDHRVEYRHGGSGYGPALERPVFVDSMDGTGLDGYRPPDGGQWRRTKSGIEVTPEETGAALFVDDSFDDAAVWRVGFDGRGSGTVGVRLRVAPKRLVEFTLGPDGRRLVHRDAGGETVRWADDVVHPPDSAVDVRLAVDGDVLWAFVDDVPVCAVADVGPRSGSFGPVVAGDEAVTVTQVEAYESETHPRLFTETFADGSLDGWTVVDEPPETTRTSDWRVADGTLGQHSNIYGFHGEPYGEPGTVAVTEESFTDGRVTVRLRSDDDDAIAVVVRRRDDENFYRFSMDSERAYRRFDRQVDGVTVPLWRDEESFETGREYVFTVDCDGDSFTGYLDGVELFSVRDDAIDAGSVALYARANVGARFHDVRVTAAADQWVGYHAFEDGDVAAGTQFRLHAGAGATRSGAGIRAVSVSDYPRLPTTGAEVRLVCPDGVTHQRWVSPAAAFTAVGGIDLCRAGDGTGVYLSTGAELPPGTHRLAFEYDRGAVPTQSQRGDRTPERATLDVSHSVE